MLVGAFKCSTYQQYIQSGGLDLENIKMKEEYFE